MHHYRLKEIEVGDTAIRMGKKSTVSAIDDKTGRIEWDIVDAADFSSVYKSLSKAKDFLSTLEKEGKAKDDTVIDGFARDIAKLFNAFRTHVRKTYPKEYERVSRLKESITEAKNMTFGDFLDDLDNRFVDILKAAKGLNAENSNTIDMRATLNQNFTLFRNYISALKKQYSDELGKELTFSVEEMSTTGGGAGAASFSGGTGMQYATPYAFRLKGKKPNIKAYKEMGYEEVKEDISLEEMEEFAEGRGEGADKIAENAKEKGGNSMLTYHHFKVKSPYYKKASDGNFNKDKFTEEYKGFLEELSESTKDGMDIDPIAFQEVMGKIEVLGELLIENKEPLNEIKEDIGATLGPGPKASSDGVKDSAYVKQFKYSLVPKKIKNSGIEVKQLFEDDTPQVKFQKQRIEAFSVIEKELNDIYKMISNAKDETLDYYNDNPSSYAVVKSTDLVIDYLRDIKSLLKPT